MPQEVPRFLDTRQGLPGCGANSGLTVDNIEINYPSSPVSAGTKASLVEAHTGQQSFDAYAKRTP